MKIKNILFALALLGCITTATAQDVTILHMKDGTTRRYTNGVKETTEINFYEFTPESAVVTKTSTQHDNGYQVEWSVNGVWNDNGKYTVGIYWKDNVPDNFKARRGVLMGTTKGLSIDKCDHKAYYEDEKMRFNNILTTSLSLTEGGRYMIIGQRRNDYSWKVQDQENNNINSLLVPDTTRNIIEADLEQGKTYYYCTFAEGQVEEGGKTKTVVFYGDERSFRIPYVMADNGYYAYVERGTDDAMDDFAKNFPDSIDGIAVTPPSWEQMEPLWNLWRATDEGKKIDLSADITTEQFDDGTGYRLNRIPQEFYTWLTKREVVIDAVDGLAEITKYYDNNTNDSISTAVADTIYNVEVKWGVPGNKYIRFEQIEYYTSEVTYSSSEVVPGVRYKLQLNFAPETKYENADSTASYFLPTNVRITAISGKNNTNTVLFSRAEVSATETTTLEVDDFCAYGMGLSLRYANRTLQSQINRGTHNRIMRIAEIRLTPITPTE